MELAGIAGPLSGLISVYFIKVHRDHCFCSGKLFRGELGDSSVCTIQGCLFSYQTLHGSLKERALAASRVFHVCECTHGNIFKHARTCL